jgi:hypothetical protein
VDERCPLVWRDVEGYGHQPGELLGWPKYPCLDLAKGLYAAAHLLG